MINAGALYLAGLGGDADFDSDGNPIRIMRIRYQDGADLSPSEGSSYAADILHELFHLAGASDAQLQQVLGIPVSGSTDSKGAGLKKYCEKGT